jgi:hypothetical protein
LLPSLLVSLLLLLLLLSTSATVAVTAAVTPPAAAIEVATPAVGAGALPETGGPMLLLLLTACVVASLRGLPLGLPVGGRTLTLALAT